MSIITYTDELGNKLYTEIEALRQNMMFSAIALLFGLFIGGVSTLVVHNEKEHKYNTHTEYCGSEIPKYMECRLITIPPKAEG